jgi:LacI family transcriptional regulator
MQYVFILLNEEVYMKIKIKDIAQKASVSDGTVSNALNNRKGISEEKKEYILRIAKEMGYFKSNSDTITCIRLLIVNNQAHVIGDTPFFSELIRGIETECSSQGYDLIISHVNSEDLNTTHVIDILKADQTSGILLLATEMETQDLHYFENAPIPLVVLDTAFKDFKFDYVAINNVDGTYEIIAYLIENGHTNIGIINSSYQINNFRERKLGYMQALHDHNLAIMPENEALVDPTPEGAYQDMKLYLQSFLSEYSQEKLPSAFYAVNDTIALGAMKAFNELHLSISICGFDDIPVAKLVTPSLTTVHVNKRYLGKIGIVRLVDKIKHQDTDIQKILIATQITERNSVQNIK